MAKKYVPITVGAYFDRTTGDINLIGKDDKLSGKPFHITLKNNTSTFETVYELLENESKGSMEIPLDNLFRVNHSSLKALQNEIDTPGRPGGEAPVFLLGSSKDRTLLGVDLRGNMLIVGNTGSGKTELLRTLFAQVPNVMGEAHVFGNDYDGHLKAVVDRADGQWHEINKTFSITPFAQLQDKLHERIDGFDLLDKNSPAVPPVYIFIDELYSIFSPRDDNRDSDRAYVLSVLESIAVLGKAVNMHLVVTTQRPDATLLPGALKANLSKRVLMGCSESLIEYMTLNKKSNFNNKLKEVRGRGVIINTHEPENEILFQAPLLDD